jgi:hypothetical protein
MNHETHEEGSIPALWPIEPGLPSMPANNFAIAKAGDFVYLTFGEVRPLILQNFSEEQMKQLREEGVPIKLQASIVLANDGYNALTHLLVNALEPKDLEKLAEHIQELIQKRQE